MAEQPIIGLSTLTCAVDNRGDIQEQKTSFNHYKVFSF